MHKTVSVLNVTFLSSGGIHLCLYCHGTVECVGHSTLGAAQTGVSCADKNRGIVTWPSHCVPDTAHRCSMVETKGSRHTIVTRFIR